MNACQREIILWNGRQFGANARVLGAIANLSGAISENGKQPMSAFPIGDVCLGGHGRQIIGIGND